MTSRLKEVILEEWDGYLKSTGRPAAQDTMARFLSSLEVEIDSVTDLERLRDVISVAAGRTTLALLYRERHIVACIVTAILRYANSTDRK